MPQLADATVPGAATDLPAGAAAPREGWRFVAAAMAAFLALGLLNILTHEMWRDELQAWAIARDSSSLAELFHNTRYEGHPPLWFLMLHALTRVTGQLWTMQAMHFVLAAGAAYLFLRYSPFARLQKVLFVMGFFPAYEYLAISRNYGMGMLLIFGLCVLYQQRARHYLAISCLLFLLSLTNVYTLIMAIAFGAMLACEAVADRRARSAALANKPALAAAIAIYLAGLAWPMVALETPPDGGFAGWFLAVEPGRMLWAAQRIWRALAPIPKMPFVRDSNILGDDVPGFVGGLLGLLLLAGLMMLFARRKRVFVFYALATFGGLAFMYLRHMGTTRHDGHYYVILIASLWMGAYEPSRAMGRGLAGKLSALAERAKTPLLWSVLAIHLVVGLWCMSQDWRRPFTCSHQAAKFIEEKQLTHMLLAGEEDYSVACVGIRLNKKVFYPQGSRWGSFILWDKNRLVSDRASLDRLIELQGRRVLLIMNRPIKPGRQDLQMIAQFQGGIIGDEQYFLYVVKDTPPEENASNVQAETPGG